MKYISLVFLLSLFSCKNFTKEEKSISEGKIRIAVDESLKPILEAQIAAYKIRYPKAEIIPTYISEQNAIRNLILDSVDVAATTRGFTQNEINVLKSKGVEYQPARMAIDAVALITNKANSDTSITIAELKSLLTDKNSSTKLVFDYSNSSNLDYLLEKLGLSKIDNPNVFAAKGNLKVFDYIKSNSNAIGFVGYNWISEANNINSKTLKNGIRVMSVSDKEGYYSPSFKTLKARKYPLERFIYLHTLYHLWGIEDGFIRFSCSKVGQLVTEKMGLVPFYIIPKEFILNREKLKNVH